MSIEEAKKLADPKIVSYNQYRVIPKADALVLLGEDKMQKLLADPIRKHGPAPDLFYWWNVCTYMMM